MFYKTIKDVLLRFFINRDSITSIFYYSAAVNRQSSNPNEMWRDLFMFDQYFEKFDLAPEVTAALKKCKCIAYAETKAELEEMAYGPTHTSASLTVPLPSMG